MKFFILGSGYVGKALLKKESQACGSFFASTTSEEKAPLLRPFAEEVFVLKSQESEKLEKIIEASDGIGIFIAPKQGQGYEIYLETAKTISSILKKRTRPFYLIYTSSTFVYEGAAELCDEESPLTGAHPKAQLLLEAERIYLTCSSKEVQICILRLGGLYGPGRELENRTSHLSGKTLPGTGLEPTNHIHLDDVVTAIEFCIKNRIESIYNLVNDDHPTRKELYTGLCHSRHIPPPSWDDKDSSTHGCGQAISNKKIKNLGFVFAHPLLNT